MKAFDYKFILTISNIFFAKNFRTDFLFISFSFWNTHGKPHHIKDNVFGQTMTINLGPIKPFGLQM